VGRNVSPVKYELGFYIPEDDILHSHCRDNLKSYIVTVVSKRSLATDVLRLLSYVYTATISSDSSHTGDGVPQSIHYTTLAPYSRILFHFGV
jgi:hypothetical protein